MGRSPQKLGIGRCHWLLGWIWIVVSYLSGQRMVAEEHGAVIAHSVEEQNNCDQLCILFLVSTAVPDPLPLANH